MVMVAIVINNNKLRKSMKNKITKNLLIVALIGFILSLPILYVGYSAMWEKGTKITVFADYIFTAGLLLFILSVISFLIWIITSWNKK